MVPLRFLTFLFLLSNASKLATATETENLDQVPCEDGPTTKKPIIDHCRNHLGGAPYKRKSGWWCSQGYYLDVQSTTQMSLEEGINLCEMNGYQLSSLELDQERKDYAAGKKKGSKKVNRFSLSSSSVHSGILLGENQYEPNQWTPNVMDPNGAGVFTLSRDPSVPGHGRLSIVSTTGRTTGPTTPFVRGVICGAPGLD
ncbi:unnamed protein product [Caenorhabditis brenneri]